MSQDSGDHQPATDPPGAVSNQNGEEAESGHREDGRHPESRTGSGPGSKDGDAGGGESPHNESRDSGGVTGRQ